MYVHDVEFYILIENPLNCYTGSTINRQLMVQCMTYPVCPTLKWTDIKVGHFYIAIFGAAW